MEWIPAPSTIRWWLTSLGTATHNSRFCRCSAMQCTWIKKPLWNIIHLLSAFSCTCNSIMKKGRIYEFIEHTHTLARTHIHTHCVCESLIRTGVPLSLALSLSCNENKGRCTARWFRQLLGHDEIWNESSAGVCRWLLVYSCRKCTLKIVPVTGISKSFEKFTEMIKSEIFCRISWMHDLKFNRCQCATHSPGFRKLSFVLSNGNEGTPFQVL